MAGYNERAWAADVIVEINRIVFSRSMPIRRAGGEYSVATAAGGSHRIRRLPAMIHEIFDVLPQFLQVFLPQRLAAEKAGGDPHGVGAGGEIFR